MCCDMYGPVNVLMHLDPGVAWDVSIMDAFDPVHVTKRTGLTPVGSYGDSDCVGDFFTEKFENVEVS